MSEVKDFNSHFGIKKSIKERIRSIDEIMDTKVIKRPDLAFARHKIPPWEAIYFDCSVCISGVIMVDQRMSSQVRQCNQCHNVFIVNKSGMGNFTLQFTDKIRPSPHRSW